MVKIHQTCYLIDCISQLQISDSCMFGNLTKPECV